MRESMKKSFQIPSGIVKWVGVLLVINFLFIQQATAQAPDCDQCDDLIDDPVAYAECVEENCNDAIPIDSHVWMLILGGVAMGAYAFYKYNSLEVKQA